MSVADSGSMLSDAKASSAQFSSLAAAGPRLSSVCALGSDFQSQTVCPSVAEWLYSSPVFLFANNGGSVVMQHSSEKKAEKLMKREEMQE